MDYLVTPEWLEARLDDPGVVVLDCTWLLPEAGRTGADLFREGHIPGARHFDLDEISDQNSTFANMLPPAELFAAKVGELGVSNDSLVVIYDSTYVSARVFWTFRHFGHDNVRILDGGMRRWRKEGRPETTNSHDVTPASFKARGNIGQVADWREVLKAVGSTDTTILDARTPERFSGAASSGYPGVAGGHMPGAVNIPWNRLIEQTGEFRFVSPEVVAKLLSDAGVETSRPMILTCGSGVTAAIIAFQLDRLNIHNWRLYDASWHEWGQRTDLPKESL